MSQTELAKSTVHPARETVWISIGFVFVITVVPILQLVGELRAAPQSLPTACRLFPALFQGLRSGFSTSGPIWRRGLTANSNLCREFITFEKSVTTSAWPVWGARDGLQAFLSSVLATGNEQVEIGGSGTLQFRPDIDALTCRGFLRTEVTRPGMARAMRAANPIPAIRQFAKDLKARGIELVLVPIPSKAAFLRHQHSDQPVHTSRAGTEKYRKPIHNADFQALLDHLSPPASTSDSDANLPQVSMIGDLDQEFERAARDGVTCYLNTDTHWTMAGMDIVVQSVQQEIRRHPTLGPVFDGEPAKQVRWQREIVPSVSKRGDIAALLGEMAQLGWQPDEAVVTKIVDAVGEDWQPDSRAEILVLGDSFCNIYSQGELGWGNSAGFVEHLSHALGVPLDRIALNAGGALGSRQELIRQLQNDPHRLTRKKLVIWEFAERELSFGDWQILPLPEAPSSPSIQTSVPESSPSGEITVEGKIIQIGRMPDPQSMPYREALLPIHLQVTASSDERKDEAGSIRTPEIVVYVWGMKERRATLAAGFQSSQIVRLKVVPWSQVDRKYGRFARIELDDPDATLLDLPTFWGEFEDENKKLKSKP